MTIEDPYQLLSKSYYKKLIDLDMLDEWLTLFLREAENIFGPKLHPYPGEISEIYFGGTRSSVESRPSTKEDSMLLRIRIHRNAKNDISEALFALCHESVHLISPTSTNTMLEEGMACWYQMHWSVKCPEVFPSRVTTPNNKSRFQKKYTDATELVTRLLAIDSLAILRIRQTEPRLDKITSELIEKVVPEVSRGLAKAIVKRWQKPASPHSTRSNLDLDKRHSNIFSEPIFGVQKFPDDRQNSSEKNLGFTKWTQLAGTSQGSFSKKVAFGLLPALELRLRSPEQQSVLFKHFSVETVRGKELLFTVFTRGENTYYRGEIIIKITNSFNALVFKYFTGTSSGCDSWTKHIIAFAVPEDSLTLEISFRLQRPSVLWIASPTLTEKINARQLTSITENDAPVNLDLTRKLESQSIGSGWHQVLSAFAKNGTRNYHKTVRLTSKTKYLKQNCLELRSTDNDSDHFCSVQQTFCAKDHSEKTIRFIGMTKFKNIGSRCEPFIELHPGHTVAGSTFSGENEWTAFAVQTKVPKDCDHISIGFRLVGEGIAFISALCFESK